jgi:hypothetical protein
MKRKKFIIISKKIKEIEIVRIHLKFRLSLKRKRKDERIWECMCVCVKENTFKKFTAVKIKNENSKFFHYLIEYILLLLLILYGSHSVYLLFLRWHYRQQLKVIKKNMKLIFFLFYLFFLSLFTSMHVSYLHFQTKKREKIKTLININTKNIGRMRKIMLFYVIIKRVEITIELIILIIIIIFMTVKVTCLSLRWSIYISFV